MDNSQNNSDVIIFKGSPSQSINFKVFIICAFVFILSLIGPSIINSLASSNSFIYNNKNIFITLLKISFIIPILYAGIVWLKTKNHKYLITNERLKEQIGILSKVTDELELYRVKDITLEEPFYLRIFKCSNIILDTSDKTTPIIVLSAIKNADVLLNKLRSNVEIMRERKGVREID